MKKIVVASDSFKGSLTSLQVAAAVEQGIRKVYPECEVVKLNVADGEKVQWMLFVPHWEGVGSMSKLMTRWDVV